MLHMAEFKRNSEAITAHGMAVCPFRSGASLLRKLKGEIVLEARRPSHEPIGLHHIHMGCCFKGCHMNLNQYALWNKLSIKRVQNQNLRYQVQILFLHVCVAVHTAGLRLVLQGNDNYLANHDFQNNHDKRLAEGLTDIKLLLEGYLGKLENGVYPI